MAVMTISLVAQILLGWLLIDRDFGVYAIAMAFHHVFRVCTDGGVGLWLARLSQDEYDRDCGHAFWLASGLSTIVAAIVALLAIPISRLYGEPQIALLLWVLAAAMPINALRIVLLPGLQVHLKFRTLAQVKLISALVRFSMVVGLAFAGFGALSFVIPIVAVTILESLAYFISLQIPVWQTKFRWSKCKRILSESCWSLAGTLTEALTAQVDYAVLGLVATTEVVGIYFFAYQLTIQLVLLFSESLRKVILPVFTRVEEGSEAESRGLRISASFVGIVAAPAMLLLTTVAEPLESLLWNHRWESAVGPMQLLAAVMPAHLVSIFAEMLTQSRGKFRLWAGMILVRGLLFAAVVFGAGAYNSDQDVTRITGWLAAYIGIAAIAEMIVLFRGNRLDWRSFLAGFLPPYLAAASVAAGMLWFFHSGGPPILDLSLRIVIFSAAIGILFTTAFPQSLQDVISTARRIGVRS